MSAASDERTAFASTLRGLGPDAPTLCDGWRTRDLAAHVVIREARPDAALGIALPPLAGYTQTVQDRYAGGDWSALVNALASGPPWWSPMKPIDRWANPAEMFVHHEDARRGQPGWTVRDLPSDLDAALRRTIGLVGRQSLRGAPVRIRLVDDTGSQTLAAGSGPLVTVTGTVGELTLFCFGRDDVDLTFDGESENVEALRAYDRSM